MDSNSPEYKREKLRQEELKNNAIGNFNDSLNESQRGMADFTGGMSSKMLGIVIVVLLLLIAVAWMIFN
ncbi:DUF6366 family protein [Macrococcus lamae]|uniref:Phage capsid protein n=1 Tax=Macrococcus lamae TaxID=198484 RepID=A0A4R6BTR7_9STAP|nr:DUF6366 family protein [Macrococcus lamae]TDM07704.1 hypothetical protein ERX29_08150 [Macrococcus lamae]